MFSDKQKTVIAKALAENLGEYHCPMCGESRFSIIEEFGLYMIRPLNDPTNTSWGVPYIMLVCRKCGYMSQHNAISLGLLDSESALSLLSSFKRMNNNKTK